MASEEIFNEFDLVQLDNKCWREVVKHQLAFVILSALPRYFKDMATDIKNSDELVEHMGDSTDLTDIELGERTQRALTDGFELQYVIPKDTDRQAIEQFGSDYTLHLWKFLFADHYGDELNPPDSFLDYKQLQEIKLWMEKICECRNASTSHINSIDEFIFTDTNDVYWSARSGSGRRPDLFGHRRYEGHTQKKPVYLHGQDVNLFETMGINYATITADELMRAFIDVFLGPGEVDPIVEIMESWDTESDFIAHIHSTVEDYFDRHYKKFGDLLQRWEDIPRMSQLSVDTSLIHVTLEKDVDQHAKDNTTQSIKLTGIEDDDMVPEISLHTWPDRFIPCTNVNENAYWEIEHSFWVDFDCSSDSWPHIQERAENGIETVLWLIESMHPKKSDRFGFEDQVWIKYRDAVCKSWGSPEDIPPFHIGTSSQLSEDGKYLQLLLKAWWEPWSKKDTFPRRIRNAILLAFEAKNQGNPAIRFAILTSALEALLGDKRPDLTQMIATRCSVLLEPEPKNRPACQKIIKRLYNTRSRILHGQEPHAEFLDTHLMRMILSAALRAAVGFRLMTQSIGTHDKLVDIVTEIDDHASSGQPLLGTTPQLVRIAWGVAWEKQSQLISEEDIDSLRDYLP